MSKRFSTNQSATHHVRQKLEDESHGESDKEYDYDETHHDNGSSVVVKLSLSNRLCSDIQFINPTEKLARQKSTILEATPSRFFHELIYRT